MEMQKRQAILVIGATGAMGRKVIEHLLQDTDKQWFIRALTRDIHSDRAFALTNLSDRIELFQGNSRNVEDLQAATHEVYGIYCNTDMWGLFSPSDFPNELSYLEASRDAEIAQGNQILEIAKAANVQHFVYSSLDHMSRLSGGKFSVPHSDAKAIVQEEIENKWTLDDWYRHHTTVLQTTSYFENLQSYFAPQPRSLDDPTLVFTLPMANKPWTMIALDDIGVFARYIFGHPEQTVGTTLAVASQSITMQEVVETFTEITGIQAVYDPFTVDQFRSFGYPGTTDLSNMFEFLQTYGCDRDFDWLRKIHPHLTSFKEWLHRTRWKGEPIAVQKSIEDQSKTNSMT
ncbi:NmrA/HSCARG family protein [Leptolyngbya sp. AN03gr2]|uniref:NmrA/HSCARG family protein n=1 Tax=unclassified Leptolyngbya TaxID=2650499 RepID=UPI003D318464